MLENLKNKLDLLAKKTAQQLVSEEIRDSRLNICNSCQIRIESINVCRKCGCFLPAKTKLAIAGCPIGKWDPVVINKE
jgi:hypothetical protein